MSRVYEFIKNWSFLGYILSLIVFLMLMGGGLKTTAYVVSAASVAIFVLWKYKIGESRDKVMYWSKALLIALVFVSFFSYLFSTTPNVGLNDVVGVFIGVLVFFVGYRYFRSKTRVLWFFRIMLIITVISCLYGFAVYIFYPFDRLAGPLVDLGSYGGFFPNAWVDYLILVFPYTVVMQFSRSIKNRYDKFLGCFSMMLILTSLMLTYSRGGWLVFVLSLVLIGFIYLLFQKLDFNLKKIVKWGVKLMLIFVASVVFVISINLLREYNGYQVNSFYKKTTFQADEGLSSISERTQFHDASLKLIREQPWFGFGPYSFRYVFPRYQKEMLAFSDHPHSVLHKIAVEAGIIPLILFFIFLAACIAVIRHSLSKSYRSNWGIRVTVGASIVGISLHNMIDYNLNFLVILLLFSINLSIAFGNTLPKHYNRVFKRGWQWWATMAMVFICMIVGLHEGYYGYYLKKARGLEGSVNEEEMVTRLEYYKKADNLWQNRDVPVAIMNNYIVLGDYEAADEYAAANSPKYKYYAELWYHWGEALLKMKRYEEAKDKFLYAIEMDPLNELRYYLGLYKSLEGMNDKYQMDYWRFTIITLLEDYYGKLKQNAHYTVLTANPGAAIELYKKLGMPYEANKIKDLYDLEMDKLNNPKKYVK